MSKPRYGWWSYVKDMIRRYPTLEEEYRELHKQSVTGSYSSEPRSSDVSRVAEKVAIRELPSNKQREYEAVRRAIETTERYKDGRDRLYIIDAVLWRRSHTLEGAALLVPCSYRTARRYHTEFICGVANNYGLMD